MSRWKARKFLSPGVVLSNSIAEVKNKNKKSGKLTAKISEENSKKGQTMIILTRGNYFSLQPD